MNMKKLLIAAMLLLSSVSFAAIQTNTTNATPHVEVTKNQSISKSQNKMVLRSSAMYVPHIRVVNDPLTHHSFSVNSNGAIVELNPGDWADFDYYNFPAGPQAMTIISDDGTVVFNDYAPDQSTLYIVTYETPSSTTYKIIIE